MTRSLVLWLFPLLLVGCVVEAGPPTPLPQGDLDAFAANVQPIMASRCSDPTCHGRVDRPLEIYSIGRHRSDPTRVFVEETLTADELADNARNVAVFMLEAASVDECAVLVKPLARAAGGSWHGGGEIFPSRDDREYRAVRAWLGALRVPE